MLQESKDKNLHNTIDLKIIEMVDKRFHKSDYLLARTIRDAICEVGLTQLPESYATTWVKWGRKLQLFFTEGFQNTAS